MTTTPAIDIRFTRNKQHATRDAVKNAILCALEEVYTAAIMDTAPEIPDRPPSGPFPLTPFAQLLNEALIKGWKEEGPISHQKGGKKSPKERREIRRIEFMGVKLELTSRFYKADTPYHWENEYREVRVL